MTTAISTNVKTIDYPALSPDSRQSKVIAANLDGEPMSEMDLIRVKTPLGGGTTWNIDNNGNVESTDEIVGLLVAVGKRGYLWPSEDPTEQRPVLETRDLLVARRVSDDLGASIDPKVLERFRVGDRTYDWTAISSSPEFGYGSGRGGSGKRVKEHRILAILREGDVWPMLVTVGAGSLRNWLPFSKRLPDFHYACVVGLKLARAKGTAGQPYSQIVPRLVGTVSEEQAEVARRIYTDPLNRMFSTYSGVATTTVEAGE